MGQAKQRGTREDRINQSKERTKREIQEAADRLAAREEEERQFRASLPEDKRKAYDRVMAARRRRQANAGVLLASMAGIAEWMGGGRNGRFR